MGPIHDLGASACDAYPQPVARGGREGDDGKSPTQ